ncbi:MAG: ribosomal L7Ae/L30e/S12e/Gadd45 family protein [Clostridia bacterium]|nr:ribosomal L7Ae/L30e/S12e/Gadd45 family protein [Clostridia bacterium]
MPVKSLQKTPKFVGVKQSKKALLEGSAVRLLVARDAQPALVEPLIELAAQKEIPIEWVDTMKSLGEACSVKVGAAAVALLSE